MIYVNLKNKVPASHSSLWGGCLGDDIGLVTLADVRGMVMSSCDNVNAQLAENGEGSEGNAAGAVSSLFAGWDLHSSH